ncbi:MAG TPA: hypothetical protein VJ111_06795 [Chitinophagaceae bacterium]|nr:hypothetical protein [Chitinophagaceae bacterium]
MNPKFTLSITAGIYFTVMAMQPYVASISSVLAEIKEEKRPSAKTNYSPMNNHAVKIYPDIIKKSMHVVAKENDGKEIDFFVFDLQGILLKHYRMTEGDHVKITGLKRGKYIYHVFCGDEETATGKLDIR